MKYRPEIDGLRGIAVLAVAIFHIDNTWLQSGFLGVDIFYDIRLSYHVYYQKSDVAGKVFFY